MKVTREYVRLYAKMSLNNKIGFVWYLVFPLIIFFSANYQYVYGATDIYAFYHQCSLFLAYITFAMAVEVTTSLIGMRENGFFKMFKFISGSTYPIFIGKMINQLLFLIASIFIFSLITGLFSLRVLGNVVFFLFSSILVSVAAAVPVMLIFLTIMLVPIRQEVLITTLNILLFVFIVLAANQVVFSVPWGYILMYLSPLEFIRALYLYFVESIMNKPYSIHPMHLVVGTLIYSGLGLISMRYIRTVSPTYRT